MALIYPTGLFGRNGRGSTSQVLENQKHETGGELRVSTWVPLLNSSTRRSFPSRVSSAVDDDQGTATLAGANSGDAKIRKIGGGNTDVRYRQAILRSGDAISVVSVAAKCERPVYRRESEVDSAMAI